MTDYNTMTAPQCADWLAERDGWTCAESGWYTMMHDMSVQAFSDDPVWHRNGKQATRQHPYPLTLDAAAAALRNPWRLAKVCCIDGMYNCTVWKNAGSICTIENATDELTARYRAAVAARMEDER